MPNDTSYAAPVMPVDCFYRVGQSIWPCEECLPWHFELAFEPDGTVFIREWHAVGCQALARLGQASS